MSRSVRDRVPGPLHKRPEKDTVNPPGQIIGPPLGRKLRDYIKHVQKQEGVVEWPVFDEVKGG